VGLPMGGSSIFGAGSGGRTMPAPQATLKAARRKRQKAAASNGGTAFAGGTKSLEKPMGGGVDKRRPKSMARSMAAKSRAPKKGSAAAIALGASLRAAKAAKRDAMRI